MFEATEKKSEDTEKFHWNVFFILYFYIFFASVCILCFVRESHSRTFFFVYHNLLTTPIFILLNRKKIYRKPSISLFMNTNKKISLDFNTPKCSSYNNETLSGKMSYEMIYTSSIFIVSFEFAVTYYGIALEILLSRLEIKPFWTCYRDKLISDMDVLLS